MKKLFVAILFSLSGIFAHATDLNFAGDWSAKETGTMTLTQNDQVQGTVACHDIHFSIDEKETTLAINDGYIWCGYAYEVNLWTYDFTIEGDKIISRGKEIGTYSPDRIFIRQADETTFLEIEITKHVDVLSLTHKTIDFHLRSFDGLTLVDIQAAIPRKMPFLSMKYETPVMSCENMKIPEEYSQNGDRVTKWASLDGFLQVLNKEGQKDKYVGVIHISDEESRTDDTTVETQPADTLLSDEDLKAAVRLLFPKLKLKDVKTVRIGNINTKANSDDSAGAGIIELINAKNVVIAKMVQLGWGIGICGK